MAVIGWITVSLLTAWLTAKFVHLWWAFAETEGVWKGLLYTLLAPFYILFMLVR